MDKDKIEKLVNDGLSVKEISQNLGISIAKVRKLLNRFNLVTRWRGYLDFNKKYSDEYIIEVAKKSDSINQFLFNLGVIQTGGSWYHYKKRLKRLNITFPDAINIGKKRGGLVNANKKNSQSILKKQRLPRHILKKSMDLANTLYKCNRCLIDEWRGQKIKLHIHHKDDNKTNNNISNLEYLCPNCHGIEHYIES